MRRRAIADDEANPSERLTPARDLAAVLDVNTNTVLRALQVLRDEGLPDFRREPAPPPRNPAQFRARDDSVRLHELLFDPSTGRSLGSRIEIGELPGLIRPPKAAPHR